MSGSRSVTTAQPSLPPRRRAEQQRLNNRSYATPVTSPPLPVPRPGSRAAAPPPGGGRTFFADRTSGSRFHVAIPVRASCRRTTCRVAAATLTVTPINPNPTWLLLGVRLDVVQHADEDVFGLDVRTCVGQQADRQALANCKPRRAQPFIPSVIARLPVGQAATQQCLVARMGGWALIRATTSGDTARLRAHKLEVTCSLTSLPAR